MVVGGRELIDTLWNVNYFVYVAVIPCVKELIDTLWNVNINGNDGKLGRHLRINRYIMECKSTSSHCFSFSQLMN